jgi:hypothetical protein
MAVYHFSKGADGRLLPVKFRSRKGKLIRIRETGDGGIEIEIEDGRRPFPCPNPFIYPCPRQGAYEPPNYSWASGGAGVKP